MTYNIERFDVILQGDTKYPIIYIKPDIKFLSLVESNFYQVYVCLHNTNTTYDNYWIKGIVSKSCDIPNCRPNYYECTGYYVITLQCPWYGYPSPCSLGQVSFLTCQEPSAL